MSDLNAGGSTKKIGRPSFLCVGSQRAGTTNLYRMLRQHPEIWMPPIKELHFFDLPLDRSYRREEIAKARRLGGKREARFLDRLEEATDINDQSIKRYKSLFRVAGGKVAGDITPGYGPLPAETVSQLARSLPKTVVLLILREPVSRLWSHVRMVDRRRPSAPLANIEAFKEFCADPVVQARSRQSIIYEKWKAAFGDRFHTLFFDDLIGNSQEFYQQVHRIVGVEPRPVNLKRERDPTPTPKMPDDMRCEAIISLKGEYERLAQFVGGHAITWAERAKSVETDAA